MTKANFMSTLMVDQTAKEVFNAINNVRGWWGEEIEGSTDKLNEEWGYHYQDVHRCKMKIVEFISNKKVVWLVVDNYFSFTKYFHMTKNSILINSNFLVILRWLCHPITRAATAFCHWKG